jgi:hypothetical protein
MFSSSLVLDQTRPKVVVPGETNSGNSNGIRLKSCKVEVPPISRLASAEKNAGGVQLLRTAQALIQDWCVIAHS